MAQSRSLLTMADDIRELVTTLDVPDRLTGLTGRGLAVTVGISIDGRGDSASDEDGDPDVAAFWGKLAVEAGKVIAAGIAGAIGAVIADGGGGNCKTTETTETTRNPDGSTTTRTIKETTCTAD